MAVLRFGLCLLKAFTKHLLQAKSDPSLTPALELFHATLSQHLAQVTLAELNHLSGSVQIDQRLLERLKESNRSNPALADISEDQPLVYLPKPSQR